MVSYDKGAMRVADNFKEKDFLVHIPVDIEKSKDGDEWRIKGIASTGDTDLHGESVDQEGLDISALKAGRGIFNVDHQKGPENVVGIIEDADFIDVDGKKCLQVEGYLLKEQDRAKAFYNIMKSLKKGTGPRIHMSIEGKILQRDFSDQKRIKKARIDKVALTLDPVNPYTFAELCKSLNSPDDIQPDVNGGVVHNIENIEEMVEVRKSDLEVMLDFIAKARLHFEQGSFKENPKPDLIQQENAEEEVQMADNQAIADKMKAEMKKLQDEIVKGEDTEKAMAAGAGHANAPESRTDGEAMSKESLDKNCKTTTYKKKKKKNTKEMVKSLMDGMKVAFPDQDPWELAGWAIEAFIDKEQ